ATNTYDREGTASGPEQPFGWGAEDVEKAMRRLTGKLEQLPPPFSAKKIGGIPAHKFARRNQSIPMAAAPVEIHEFEMLALEPPQMSFRVVCSPGTYVRSLAHDLGQMLGCGAHLTALRRTRSGDFRITDAVRLEKLSAADLIPLEGLLPSV